MTEFPTIGGLSDAIGCVNDIPIRVAAMQQSRLLITGNSGAGKSRTLRRLIEQTHGHVQQFIFDPEDEFFTLREKFDFILAGSEDADCPIHPGSAAALAEKAMELNISMVLGLEGLELQDRFVFVSEFLNSLMSTRKDLRRPVMVVIDEADIYAPNGCEKARPGKDEFGDCGLSVVNMAIRGRKRGFFAVLATQHPAILSATVRGACVSKLVGRQSMDIHVDRSAKDIGLRKRDMVRDLAPGEFFATGPAFDLNRGVEKIFVGECMTSHPEPGQHAMTPPPPRGEVAKILAELVAASEEKPTEESETKAVQSSGPCRECESLRSQIERAKIEGYESGVQAVLAHCNSFTSGETAVPSVDIPKLYSAEASSTPAKGGLDRAQRAILIAAASLAPKSASRIQLSIISGYSIKSSSFANALSALRTAGYLTGEGDSRRISETGLAVLGDFSPAPTGSALRKMWLDRLDKAERTILEVLIINRKGIDADQLSEISGYSKTSSSFTNAISGLRSLQLAEKGWPLRPNPELFA